MNGYSYDRILQTIIKYFFDDMFERKSGDYHSIKAKAIDGDYEYDLDFFKINTKIDNSFTIPYAVFIEFGVYDYDTVNKAISPMMRFHYSYIIELSQQF
jgi:hypothetical protein